MTFGFLANNNDSDNDNEYDCVNDNNNNNGSEKILYCSKVHVCVRVIAFECGKHKVDTSLGCRCRCRLHFKVSLNAPQRFG